MCATGDGEPAPRTRGEIRAATPTDSGGIRRVAQATWEDTYRDTIPKSVRSAFLDRAYSAESLERRISTGAFFVAVCEGEVLGFSDWHPTSETGVLLAAIYVLPDHQGRGTGSRLLRAGLERFPSARKFSLRVERDNPAARRFYEAHGFRVSGGFVEDLLGHRTHELEMVLETVR